MQQWFKTDIVKRFYMYHAMNVVLQLEKMQGKSIGLDENKNTESFEQQSFSSFTVVDRKNINPLPKPAAYGLFCVISGPAMVQLHESCILQPLQQNP